MLTVPEPDARANPWREFRRQVLEAHLAGLLDDQRAETLVECASDLIAASHQTLGRRSKERHRRDLRGRIVEVLEVEAESNMTTTD